MEEKSTGPTLHEAIAALRGIALDLATFGYRFVIVGLADDALTGEETTNFTMVSCGAVVGLGMLETASDICRAVSMERLRGDGDS